MSKNKNPLVFWSGIVGNSLDHYDSALYAFLAPFLAPVFFPDSDPLVGLILVYGVKSLGVFTRPIGAIYFGHLTLKHSPQKLLSITLIGVAISTFLIGIIPSYASIGIWAPILLTIVRGVQGIFAAGEYNIASLFILEHVSTDKNQVKASSFYICSSMVGNLLASFAAVMVSTSSAPAVYWRLAFFLGLAAGLAGIILRMRAASLLPKFGKALPDSQVRNISVIFASNRWKLLRIIPITSFSFLTYIIPFIFLNNFIPLFSNLKTSDLLIHNTFLLMIDILMIPFCGYLANKFNIAKWMASMSGLLAVTIIPLFYFLPQMDLMTVTIAKMWIIIIGVAFVAPLNALLYRMITGDEKYLVSGFSYAVGTELFGRGAVPICLSIYYYTQSTSCAAIYVALISVLATVALIWETKYHHDS